MRIKSYDQLPKIAVTSKDDSQNKRHAQLIITFLFTKRPSIFEGLFPILAKNLLKKAQPAKTVFHQYQKKGIDSNEIRECLLLADGFQKQPHLLRDL